MKIDHDYAHCNACDKVIDLDNDIWQVYYDNTYCGICFNSNYATELGV